MKSFRCPLDTILVRVREEEIAGDILHRFRSKTEIQENKEWGILIGLFPYLP